MSENLYSLLAGSFSRRPDAVCMELGDGKRCTYAELEAETARYANLLVSLGLKPGDVIEAGIAGIGQIRNPVVPI